MSPNAMLQVWVLHAHTASTADKFIQKEVQHTKLSTKTLHTVTQNYSKQFIIVTNTVQTDSRANGLKRGNLSTFQIIFI